MATCFDVANFFLSKVNPEYGENLTNLKVQKLAYYSQGFALAITGQPLFGEEIQAWEHGPVVPDLYRAYKVYGANPIPPTPDFKADTAFTPEQLEILEEVNTVYGQFSAWKLRNMTHEEAPWLDVIDEGSKVISHESMREFFKNLVEI